MNKGYVIIEMCDNFEQILCLVINENTPPKGLLTWSGDGFDRHVFSSRKLAREAIERTHHYAMAYEEPSMPEKKFCKIRVINIDVSKHSEEVRKDAFLDFACYLLDNHENYFPGGEEEIQRICSKIIEDQNNAKT